MGKIHHNGQKRCNTVFGAKDRPNADKGGQAGVPKSHGLLNS